MTRRSRRGESASGTRARAAPEGARAAGADDGDPWRVDERRCPRDGAPADLLRFLVRYALLAPSSHNAQPWLFRVSGEAVEVLADRTRALPVVDPEDRELCIGCGAALFHLRLAAAHFGREAAVELLPSADEPDLLARLRLGGARAASEEEERMFAAIPLRRTNRGRFEPWPVSEDALADLASAAVAEGAWLHVFDDAGRERAAALVAGGDRVQGDDGRFRRELAAWIHPNRSRSRDGVPSRALGAGELASHVWPVLVRTFDRGEGRAARGRELALGSPALALLGTPGDAPADWVRAGQALARVLLVAQARGVCASFLNQAIEVPELRARLQALTGRAGHPQSLLRFGYGAEVPPTPRRGLAEVLIE